MDKIVDILMGPTASGKSALALAVAQKRPVRIINADAMQCYAPLRIITARPTEEEMRTTPHSLYGVWKGEYIGHAQAWAEEAACVIRTAWAEGERPLLVGGTGMYIRALTEGFSPIPAVDITIQHEVRAIGSTAALYAALQREDATMASRLKPGDTQRITRALEVLRSTGQSLSHWQALPPCPPLAEACWRIYAMRPERQMLYARIDARFVAMMEAGALAEAERIAHLPPSLPMMKAHGVPELCEYLAGRLGYDDAIARAQINTRHYAKRQMTWLRNQLPDAQSAEQLLMNN